MKNEAWLKVMNNPSYDNFNYCQNYSLFKSLQEDLFLPHEPQSREYNLNPGKVIHIQGALKPREVANIVSSYHELKFFPVGTDGTAKNYEAGATVSSFRASCYDIDFSVALTQRLEHLVPRTRQFHPNDFSVEDSMSDYVLAGFNPYNRLIQYDYSGKLIAHYDGQHALNKDFTTLMTCLIYLSTTEGGKTVFLRDDEKNIPIAKRQKNKSRQAFLESDILLSIKPKAGDMLLFDQQLLHATTSLNHEYKTLILSDLIYQKLSDK